MTVWCFSVTKLLSCSTQEIQPLRSICQKFEIIIGPTGKKNLNMCPYKGQKDKYLPTFKRPWNKVNWAMMLSKNWKNKTVLWWLMFLCCQEGSGVLSVGQADKLCHLRSQGSSNIFLRGEGGDCGLKWCNRKSINLSLGRGHVHYEVHILCFYFGFEWCVV